MTSVHGHGELVRPVAVAVAQQQVAAVVSRHLLLWSEQSVGKRFDALPYGDAQAAIGPLLEPRVPAGVGVAFAADLLSRTGARVHGVLPPQLLQRRLVHRLVLALADEGRTPRIRLEPQPVQIIQQRGFELRPAAKAVVILDAEQHPPVHRAGDSPDVNRIHHVPEVQVPCRRGRITRERGSTQSQGEVGQVGTTMLLFHVVSMIE
jgi:hypothetical protein